MANTTRKSFRKRLLIIIAVVAALLAISFCVGVAVFNSQIDSRLSDGFSSDAAVALTQVDEEDASSYTLIVVLDGETQAGQGALSSITLARIDTQQSSASVLALPADVAVRLKSGDSLTLQEIYAASGQAGVIEAVGVFTGLEVNHYLECDLSDVCTLVDSLGGIDVEISETFFDPVQGSFEAGTHTLDGTSFRSYFLSSKAFSDGDATRAVNDADVLLGICDKLTDMGFFERMERLDFLSTMVSGDMKRADFDALRKAFSAHETRFETQVIGLSVHAGTIEDIPCSVVDADTFEATISLFNGGESSSVGSAGQTGVIVPASYTVDVRNGVGITGISSQATTRLEAAGYGVGEVGNANSFVYTETLIIYSDESLEPVARNVQTALRCGRTVENPGTYSYSGDILVIIGGDWIPE